MNHVYRIVWNHVACTWQAVAESAKGYGKGRPGGRGAQPPQPASPGFSIKPLLLALSLTTASAWAGPQGGQVVAGSASIQQTGNTTTINQGSNRAAIDWSSFSVGKTEAVRFNQPSSSAITLNRVTGTESSLILGSISANGQVFILNPNGVLFGQGAQVNVGGLVASTHGMSNADFMAGNYQLSGNGTGSVVNQGSISVPEGGAIALIAPIVKNTGTLNAPQGSVLLAAADVVSLKLQDGSLIGYTLDKGSLQALVDNGGLIHADGGHVVLTAKALDTLSKASINHSGVIEAQTVSNKNGVVELLGDMQVGEVKLSGKIDASAPNGGDGGFVETSAANIDLNQPHWVSTLSKYGKTGRWLIDPNDFVIGSGGNITAQRLHEDLARGDIAFATATQGTAGGNGDIFVNEAVSWSSHKLTLSAGRNILINASLTASGSASLALEYGQNNVASGNTANYFINNGAKVNLPAGQNFSTKLGSDGVTDIYTVITSLGVAGDTSNTSLQGMKNNLTGKYALGDDINATETADWNSGTGWQPIGSGSAFSGVFTGLQHTINGISIYDNAGGNLGLFGEVSGQIRDVRVTNSYMSTSAGGWSGVLVGYLSTGGHISNSYTSGIFEDISGAAGATGGLVGTADPNTIIERSASSTWVRGNHAAGGLVGFNFSLIEDCYATGPVSLNDYAAGGLVGINNGTVLRSYASGRVSGNGFVGGLVGLAGRDAPSTISDSYWDKESTQQNISSGGGAGKTTAEMKQRATFSGWDFANTWQIVEGTSYPTLKVLAISSGSGPFITAVLDPNLPLYSSAITGAANSGVGSIDNSGLVINSGSNNANYYWWDVPSDISQLYEKEYFLLFNDVDQFGIGRNIFFDYYFRREMGGDAIKEMLDRQGQVESDWSIDAADVWPDSFLDRNLYRGAQILQSVAHNISTGVSVVETAVGLVDPATYGSITLKSFIAAGLLKQNPAMTGVELKEITEVTDLLVDVSMSIFSFKSNADESAKAYRKLNTLKQGAAIRKYKRIIKDTMLEVLRNGVETISMAYELGKIVNENIDSMEP